ncbi:MAG: lactonase family protein [Prevotella sp.]|jgi:6-phosphogluconolactonase (cycloisomerase 2 family)|nr:lactonase family protein [Prevotella sp.]
MKYIFLIIAVTFSFLSCNNKNTNKAVVKASDPANVQTGKVMDDSGLYLIVGTYTTGESEGIYVYRFDTVSGYSTYKSKVKITNPSYLAISKNGKYVYAVSETGDDKASASAFAFDKEKGELSLLNTELTKGADPCYITVDNAGKHVVTANYSGGSITVFDVKEDGSLTTASQYISFTGKGVDQDRQQKPHLHCVTYSPDEKYLLANDLGSDKIHKFDVNPERQGGYLQAGVPAAFKIADGSGPRHLEFYPDGKFAYLINEISGAVIAFDYNSHKGDLIQKQSIQADTLNAKGSGDIHITPDGRFLYASNRLKGDGLAIFSINQNDGKLTKVGYQPTGIHPRNFVITPNGKFLLVAGRDNNAVQVFLIDRNTGLLKNTNKDIKLDKPVCLKFVSLR